MDNKEDDLSSSAGIPTPNSAGGQGNAARGKQRAAPDSEPAASTSSTATPLSQAQISKRRRGIGVVTPNACNECRKKRVKRDVECVYELPVRQSKEDLRSEIEVLRRRQRSSDAVISALNRPGIWEDILNRLHNGETVESLSEYLDTGAPATAASTATTNPNPNSNPNPNPNPNPNAAALQATSTTSTNTPSQFQRSLPSAAFLGGEAPTYVPFSPGMTQGGQSSGGSGGPGSSQSISEQQLPHPYQQHQRRSHHQQQQQQHLQPPQHQQHQQFQQHHRHQSLHQHQQHQPNQSHLQQHHFEQLNQQHGSPWGGDPYSATSQAPSTQSDSRQDWNMPPESRVGLWVEGVGPDDQSGSGGGSGGGGGGGGMGDMSSGGIPRYRGVDQILAPDMPDLKLPTTTWTDISEDLNLVQHLLALYFCWEYPTFASLSKEHFLSDFQEGRPRYCSPILVNALLALGCRFSTQPNTRAVPDDPYTSGDHFFKECQRLFYLEENHHSLTTIQALGIMSIREASCGRDSESWYYAGQSIRLAIEMGLHQIRNDDGDEDEVAVKAATFWGAFALDHAWSLATGSLPQCSCFPLLPPKPAIIDGIEASHWIPYTDDGAPLQRSCQQPSNVRSVYKCFCELSELVHQSLYILHSPGRPLTSRDLLHIYTKYLNWYDSIPEVLRLGHNFTPAVLFAHMYYHFAILLLFRPLIKLRIIGSRILPKDVCLQAADAIQGLLRSYSQLYTLQRTPSFVPYFVLTSSIMHLAIGASTSAELPPGGDIAAAMANKASTSLARRPKDSDDQSMHSVSGDGGSSNSSTGGGNGGGGGGGGGSGGGGGGGSGGGKGAHHGGEDSNGGASNNNSPSPGRGTTKLDSRVVESINRGIADLTAMVPCHHFAEQALNILRYLAKKWNIDIHITPVTKSSSGRLIEDADSDRLLRPMTTRLNFFTPNIEDSDFNCTWGVLDAGVSKGFFTGGSAASASLAKAADNLDNPLFWPFPMQGRPVLPLGKKLEEAGFALL
ncbi:c6 zinc finger domain containing protein [Sporothrix brasiliensis 5110]|uniref:C6 zinc finger domain containing protein n=1 Tax=Sporothrix brasiliensis 5110 TaxID=1398154 RepID=A0A0C2IQN6_9PEZI|nr:c6 zinc finger domain containing protein [Sporothrix brasiliensis 5110]KIH87367.1 c6 zinc finger domain containing protein [Sporothrix brasiliensis 5110]